MEILKSLINEFSVFRDPDGDHNIENLPVRQDRNDMDQNQSSFDDDNIPQDDGQDNDQACSWKCNCPFCKALKDKLGIDPSDLSSLKLLVVDVNDKDKSDDFEQDDQDSDEDTSGRAYDYDVNDFNDESDEVDDSDPSKDYDIF